MKLQIEKWVDKLKPFDANAEELFRESVICYKIGAYKSAFLMSYLAFKITIKDRILNCTYRPDLYQGKDAEWQENILKPLVDDDTWEKHLNQIIEADPNPTSRSYSRAIILFENREEAKNEYNYWKNIRNKCAHAKKGTIDSSTVECFWNYVQDNLSKFYVLGGKEYLVERLLDYYKYRDIEDDQNKILLINDINIVFKHDSQDFFSKFLERFNSSVHFVINAHNADFWKDIVESQFESIQEGFVRSIMRDSNYFISFYEHFPQILNLAVSLERRFIKDSLSKWMGNWFGFIAGRRNTIFWDILCVLLKDYSSEIDINETSRIDLSIIRGVDFDDEKLEVLKKHRVFNKFILRSGSYFFAVDFDSIGRNTGSREREVIPWFEYAEWDEEMLLAMNRAFRELNRRIESLRNSMYGSWEITRKRIYCELIQTYKDRIDLTLLETLDDLEDEFKELIMGNAK
ncbi:hypothetical protein [Aneurinibacillus uraniidurans]|uniref:hypothetical protein n=1 Tax=Aneurinibacillus uraniidurans TaxID=2966586 RepID=UPI002349D5BF|nr:hypothetical protein [Aneurinibacillus sp. B1]WCN36489.1 hypothetical protein PO771_11405 [Aneurinibacillus sp. B1]